MKTSLKQKNAATAAKIAHKSGGQPHFADSPELSAPPGPPTMLKIAISKETSMNKKRDPAASRLTIHSIIGCFLITGNVV